MRRFVGRNAVSVIANSHAAFHRRSNVGLRPEGVHGAEYIGTGPMPWASTMRPRGLTWLRPGSDCCCRASDSRQLALFASLAASAT